MSKNSGLQIKFIDTETPLILECGDERVELRYIPTTKPHSMQVSVVASMQVGVIGPHIKKKMAFLKQENEILRAALKSRGIEVPNVR